MGGGVLTTTPNQSANAAQASVIAARLLTIATMLNKMSAAAKHAANGKPESVIGTLDNRDRPLLEAILKVVHPYTSPLEAVIGDHGSSPKTHCVVTARWKGY